MKSKLSTREKIIYSLGNLGTGIITVNHMLFLVWYFFPPKEAGLKYLIPQENIFAGLTVLGLTLAAGRIFDAITDPLVANFSDKFKHKDGKRIPLLKWSAIPFAVSYLLVFLVPINEVSTVNVVWLVVWLVIATFLLTVYTISFEALLPLMAKTGDEKVDLGTISSALWFVGFLVVSFSSSLWGPLMEWLDITKLEAIRYTMILVSLVGTVFLLVPGLMLKEKDYADGTEIKTVKEKVFPALKRVMRYSSYRKFVFANTLYHMASYIFEGGLIYFITVLALMKESMLGPVTFIIGGLTLAMYPVINILSKKKGRKFVLNICFIAFAISFGIIAIMSSNPSPWLYLAFMILFVPFSQAGFGILPVIIASDNATYMKHEEGKDMSAMFMAVSGFFRKFGVTAGAIIFTSFLAMGKDVGDDIGIRFAVIFASVLSILGFVIMLSYNEKEVMKYADKDAKQIKEE